MTNHHKKWGNAYPVVMLKVSDDGPARPFHVLHCMATPACGHELRIAIGGGVRLLPTHAVLKQAHQRGWHADRRGYCLCPDHTPWAKRGGKPSDMAPDQKRAAYCAIRDRDMAMFDAAANDLDPIRSKNMELASTQTDALLDRALADPRNTPEQITTLEAILKAIDKGDFSKGWHDRTAASIGSNQKTFSARITKLTERGYLTKVPHTNRLIANYGPATVDFPTATGEADTITAVLIDSPIFEPRDLKPVLVEETASHAEPPRQPTIAAADRYRVRQFVEQFYDSDNGKWCGDMTDAKAAARLNLPRVFVTTLRAYFGEDVNEASEKRRREADAILAEAERLQDDAKALLAKAEERTAAARKLMEG